MVLLQFWVTHLGHAHFWVVGGASRDGSRRLSRGRRVATPGVGISVEADFVEGLPDDTLNDPEWERGIEENYALYGIHVDVERDDTISSTSGTFDVIGALKGSYDITTKANDEPNDLYMFVTNDPPDAMPNSNAFGVNFEAIAESHAGSAPGWAQGLMETFGPNAHFILAENIHDYAGSVSDYEDYSKTPYTSDTQLVAAMTELHELGHSFRLGEADDESEPLPGGEVYTGSTDDDTVENLFSRPTSEWGLMRAGWSDDSLFVHDGGGYHTFSMEELSTIQKLD